MELIFNKEKYISLDEVLKMLEIKEHKLYEKIKNNEISRPFKPDPRAFWRKSEIESYLESTRK